MGNLVDNAEYTPNEIYSIAQSDLLSGAGVGAPFNGIGVDNYPHQQLANRTAWLYGQVNILNSNVAQIKSVLQMVTPTTTQSTEGVLIGTFFDSIQTLNFTTPTNGFVFAFGKINLSQTAASGITTVLSINGAIISWDNTVLSQSHFGTSGLLTPQTSVRVAYQTTTGAINPSCAATIALGFFFVPLLLS